MGLGREDGPTVWFKSVSSSRSCGGGGGSRGSVRDGPHPCLWGGGTEAFPHSAGRPPPCRSSQGARGQSLGERQGDTHPFSRQLGAQCARHSAGGSQQEAEQAAPATTAVPRPAVLPLSPAASLRSTSLGEGRSFSPPPRRPGWQPTRTVGTPPAPSVGLRPASCWSEQPPNRQVQTGGRSPASPAAPLGRGDAGAVP